MRPKIFITLVFIFLTNLIYSQITAGGYKLATTSTDGTEYFVDIYRIVNGTKDIWVKNQKPLKDPKGKKVKNGGQITLMHLRMDCSNKEYDNLEIIIYDKTGRETSDTKNVSFKNQIVPGSVMTGIYDFVCGK